MLRLKTGDLHYLAALARAANLFAIHWPELFLAIFTSLDRNAAGCAGCMLALSPLKSASALFALRCLPVCQGAKLGDRSGNRLAWGRSFDKPLADCRGYQSR